MSVEGEGLQTDYAHPCTMAPRGFADGKRTQHLIKSKQTNRRKAMKIGFVGLGIMGVPMAGNLLKGGHQVHAYDLRPIPDSLTGGGAVACQSGREAAEKSDIVIVMVPDTPHVEAALFSKGGIAEGLSKGKTVVDMSSISP